MSKILTPKDNAKIVVDECAEIVLKCSPQLFLREKGKVDGGIIKPCASSILFAHLGQCYLFTAGHVIADNDPDDLGFLENNQFFLLTGKVSYFNPNNDARSNSLDIGVLHLRNDLGKILMNYYDYLTVDNLLLDHETKEHDPKYLVVGYPLRSTKLNPVIKTISQKPFIYLTNTATEEDNNRLHVNKNTKIALHYRQRRIVDWRTNHITKGVTPEGISGCGVWYINRYIYDPSHMPTLKLVAIVTDQDKNKTCLLATKIDYINELLIREFNLKIRRSRLFIQTPGSEKVYDWC